MSTIHIVFGPQGAGKTSYSKKLTSKVKGIHMSIDNWMWNLYGDDLPKSMSLKWIMERVNRCEKQIWILSKDISDNGSDVILDLGFTTIKKRELFQKLAAEHHKKIQLHYITASHSVRRKRVLERNINKGKTFSFEVTPGKFDFMEGEFQQATDSELIDAVRIDTST